MTHSCGGNRQNIRRPYTDLGHRFACSFAEAAPHLSGVEVVAESGGHPVLPRTRRAYRRARLHIKQQTSAPFTAEIEPHQVLRHLFPPDKKDQRI
jgi:hypothetical protein